jgi:hypothetical protein
MGNNGPGRRPVEDPKLRPPNVTIRESTIEGVNLYADKLGISVSAAYQEALDEWLRKQNRIEALIKL